MRKSIFVLTKRVSHADNLGDVASTKVRTDATTPAEDHPQPSTNRLRSKRKGSKELLSLLRPSWYVPDLNDPSLEECSVFERRFILSYLLHNSGVQAIVEAGWLNRRSNSPELPVLRPGELLSKSDPRWESARVSAYTLLRRSRVRVAIRALQGKMGVAYGTTRVQLEHGLLQTIAKADADGEYMASIQGYKVLAQLQGYIETRGQGTSIQVTGDRVIVLANTPDMPGFKVRERPAEIEAPKG